MTSKVRDKRNQDAMSQDMAAEQMNWEGDRTVPPPESSSEFTDDQDHAKSEDWMHTMQEQLSQTGEQLKRGLHSVQSDVEGTLDMGYSNQDLNMREVKRWTALIGGGALALWGVRRSLGSLSLAGIGGGLVYYALTGRMPLPDLLSSPTHKRSGRWSTAGISALDASASTITKSIVVKGKLADVYDVWANFENFPKFMQHIRSVEKTGETTSRWTMSGPMDVPLRWNAETTRLESNKRIAWHSTGGDMRTSGQVTFNSLPDEEVEVTVTLTYVPPAGIAGDIAATYFANPEATLVEDLRNFKRFVEG